MILQNKHNSLGIIGTAGRGADFSRIDTSVWNQAKKSAAEVINKHNITHLVSGGAAFFDHFAVQIYLKGIVKNLTLHLPCKINLQSQKFEPFQSESNVASVAGYYHSRFSKKLNIDSMAEICAAIKAGANITISNGFFVRNAIVAKDSDVLIAYTFGAGPMLKDGGTAHTMKQFLTNKPSNPAYHFDLSEMQLHNKAEVYKI